MSGKLYKQNILFCCTLAKVEGDSHLMFCCSVIAVECQQLSTDQHQYYLLTQRLLSNKIVFSELIKLEIIVTICWSYR